MISIFSKRSFMGNRYPDQLPDNCLQRVSGRIRGNEMAEHLGAKLNPASGYENDVCIYVKPWTLDHIKDGDYVDFLDSSGRLLDMLKVRPKVKVISMTPVLHKYLKKELANEIVCIPQHHLNWERAKRERKEITTAGYIGSLSPFAIKMYRRIKTRFKEIGMNFITCFDFKTRQDAINFYKHIDILVIGAWSTDHGEYRTPAKMINAASFGIPSIADPLEGYKDYEGNYLRARNIYEQQKWAEKLKDKDYYSEWSNKIKPVADKYHISNIIKLYKELA